MQRSSQIDEPDFGYLLDHMMIADGAKIPHENYCRPRVEIELAFVMGKPLKGPGIGLTEVLRATTIPLIGSGGVGGLSDLVALRAIEIDGRGLAGVIVGRALYEGRLDIEEAIAACSQPA